MNKPNVDFGYAFATPHVLTLCRPSASEKTVLEVTEDGIKFFYATQSLKNEHPLSWVVLQQDLQFAMNVNIDGNASSLSSWHRHKSGAPYFFASGKNDGVEYEISGIAVKKGVIIKTVAKNTGSSKKDCFFQFAHTNGWVISNKGWIDGENNHILMTMNNGRADKLLVCAYGADAYPLYKTGEIVESLPPMANEKIGIKQNSMKKITAQYTLDAGISKTGYFFMPYKMYFENVEEIDPEGFENDMQNALLEWEKLLKKGTEINICDKEVLHCYYSCVADLFVMREKIGKHYGISCGTRFYRSSNSGEPLESTVLLDTVGYGKIVADDYKTYFEGQDDDGCWVTRKGWEHEGWQLLFNKASAVMEHYYMTRDVKFLEENYKRMYTSTMWNYNARLATKNSKIESERGLMPRGMGDCGMMNNGDYYGVFYPHNIMAVAADYKTLQAAKILGKDEDIKKLTEICDQAKQDLITSIRNNLSEIDGKKIIPAVAGAPLTSLYGCLYAYFPTKLLSADDEIIRDTIDIIENCKKSEGGLPLGMGWMRDGLWVAMALHNVSRTYIRMGKTEEAVKYLYPALNHASPFVTWCEERGGEAGSAKITGDRHHLWTPLSICQYMTEALFLEDDDAVHICAGISWDWIGEGKEISVKNYRTHYGKTDFSVKNIGGEYKFKIKTERKIEKDILLHLPEGIRKMEI